MLLAWIGCAGAAGGDAKGAEAAPNPADKPALEIVIKITFPFQDKEARKSYTDGVVKEAASALEGISPAGRVFVSVGSPADVALGKAAPAYRFMIQEDLRLGYRVLAAPKKAGPGLVGYEWVNRIGQRVGTPFWGRPEGDPGTSEAALGCLGSYSLSAFREGGYVTILAYQEEKTLVSTLARADRLNVEAEVQDALKRPERREDRPRYCFNRSDLLRRCLKVKVLRCYRDENVARSPAGRKYMSKETQSFESYNAVAMDYVAELSVQNALPWPMREVWAYASWWLSIAPADFPTLETLVFCRGRARREYGDYLGISGRCLHNWVDCRIPHSIPPGGQVTVVCAGVSESDYSDYSPTRPSVLGGFRYHEELQPGGVRQQGAILRDGSADGPKRRDAIVALGEHARLGGIEELTAAAPIVVDPTVRAAIITALGLPGSAEAAAVVGKALGDANKDVRAAAEGAMAAIGSPAVPMLLARLKDADASGRQQAAAVLGVMREPKAVPGLGSALKDPEVAVRKQAAWSLGMVHDATVVKALTRASSDKDVSVRRQAVMSLGWTRSGEAVAPLRKALDDEDPDVRLSAVYALWKIPDASVRQAMQAAARQADPKVSQAARDALHPKKKSPIPSGLEAEVPIPEPEPNPGATGAANR